MTAAVIAAGTVGVDCCAFAEGCAAVASRARPDVTHLDRRLPASSVRSGQVAAMIRRYAATAVVVMPRTGVWWRWQSSVVAVLMPLRVTLSRWYRGVHHRTGAFSGVVVAACWVAVLVSFVLVCVVWPGGGIDRTAGTAAVAAVLRPLVGVWV